MEKEIRDRYNDTILAEAQRRYGIAPDRIKLLDGFESFMFEFEANGSEFILRLGHSRRRTPNQIRGEVDWINYLAAGGAGVAKAVLSQNGELVEPIEDAKDGQFLATAFVKAQGGSFWKMGGWSEPFMERYGRLLGRIHALSKTYRLPNPEWHRGTWQDRNNLGLEEVIPEGETAVIAAYQQIMDHLQTLPEDGDGYGMIHQDAHAGNFFVNEAGNLTLFDFDDCLYGHYAYDLAMVLFYVVTNLPDADEFGANFWQHFYRGYQQENQLDEAWLREIPHFMKLREVDLYAIILRDYDSLAGDNWVETFLKGRKERIEQNVPYMNTSFLEK